MKNLLTILTFLLSITLQSQSVYYVSTTGDDADAGTFAEPWGTWNQAFETADAGDTVYFRGGVYNSVERIYVNVGDGIGNSGTSANPIVYEGYPADIAADNWPILDCKLHCDSIDTPERTTYNYAISLTQIEYIELRCLEIRNVFQCDSVNSGAVGTFLAANMTFERIRIHDIGSPRGFWFRSGAWSAIDSAYTVDYRGDTPLNATPRFEQPDTSRWINCDVWNLCDTLSSNPGNAGDGWRMDTYHGNTNYFTGCRVWNYSDDGMDMGGGKKIFNNCWFMPSNKYAGFGIEGNCLKTASLMAHDFWYPALWSKTLYADSADLADDSLCHVTNCLSLYGIIGFYLTVQSDIFENPRLYNNTSYAVGSGILAQDKGDTMNGVFKNNLIYGAYRTGAGGKVYDVQLAGFAYNEDHNTWVYDNDSLFDFYTNPAFNVTTADFQENDSAALVALFTAPRKADGSLPDSVPCMLSATSDLIDGGVDIGYGDDIGYNQWADGGSGIVANWSASSVSIGTTESITYTDLSTNNPDTWDWDFDNGTPATSAVQNPVIQYNTAGTFDVELIASLGADEDTLLRTNYILVTDIPVSAFSANTTSVTVGQSVTFTDASTNTPTSWSWDCPGGTPSTSNSQNPTITYNTAGDYTVTLTASNAGGADDEEKIDYITVSGVPLDYKITIEMR